MYRIVSNILIINIYKILFHFLNNIYLYIEILREEIADFSS